MWDLPSVLGCVKSVERMRAADIDVLKTTPPPESLARLSDLRHRMEADLAQAAASRWPNLAVRSMMPLAGRLADAYDGLMASLSPDSSSAKVRIAVNAQKFLVGIRKDLPALKERAPGEFEMTRLTLFAPFVKGYHRSKFIRYLTFGHSLQMSEAAAMSLPGWPQDAPGSMVVEKTAGTPNPASGWPSLRPLADLLDAVSNNQAPSARDALYAVEHARFMLCRSMLVVLGTMGPRTPRAIEEVISWSRAVRKTSAKLRPAVLGFVAGGTDEARESLRRAVAEVVRPPGFRSVPGFVSCPVMHGTVIQDYYSPSTQEGVVMDGCVYSLPDAYATRAVANLVGVLRTLSDKAQWLTDPEHEDKPRRAMVDALLNSAENDVPKSAGHIPKALARHREGSPMWQ